MRNLGKCTITTSKTANEKFALGVFFRSGRIDDMPRNINTNGCANKETNLPSIFHGNLLESGEKSLHHLEFDLETVEILTLEPSTRWGDQDRRP